MDTTKMISNTNNERHQTNVSSTVVGTGQTAAKNAISSGTVTTQVRHVQKPVNLVKKSNILKSNVKASLTAEANQTTKRTNYG